MPQNQPDLLSDAILQLNTKKRRDLLPWWIKVFMWLFLIFGAMIPFILILGVFNGNVQLSLYGLQANETFSISGISISILFLIKGITAYGLLKEKDWAIKWGMIDAIVGILICISLMIYGFIYLESNVALRLELLILVPYLLRLIKIKSDWENTIAIQEKPVRCLSNEENLYRSVICKYNRCFKSSLIALISQVPDF